MSHGEAVTRNASKWVPVVSEIEQEEYEQLSSDLTDICLVDLGETTILTGLNAAGQTVTLLNTMSGRCALVAPIPVY